MDQHLQRLLLELNGSITKWRGMYAAWAKRYGVGYHELLVLYTLRDFPDCTQKTISEAYLLPKQTVHNIILDWQKQGYVVLQPGRENWREKTVVLTEAGREFSDRILSRLNQAEEQAVMQMGEEALRAASELFFRFAGIVEENLNAAAEETGPQEQ